MATLAAHRQTFLSLPFFKGLFEEKRAAAPAVLPYESAAFTHALGALAAKLTVVDGAATQAEYRAFDALFLDARRADAPVLNRHYMAHLTDRSSALQFARQITRMTGNDVALRRELLARLLRLACADAVLNAAEMEWLRAVADVFGIARDDFRQLLAAHVVPTSSPYDVLGIAASASDEALRARYMSQVQMLHPDRYLAAGASPETVAMLSDQLAALNAAYQQVRAQRTKKHASMFGGRRNMKSAKAA